MFLNDRPYVFEPQAYILRIESLYLSIYMSQRKTLRTKNMQRKLSCVGEYGIIVVLVAVVVILYWF